MKKYEKMRIEILEFVPKLWQRCSWLRSWLRCSEGNRLHLNFPWAVAYPSGLRLPNLSRVVSRTIAQL